MPEPLAAIIEGVRDYAIFMLNRDGFVLTWSSGAERIKGYRAEEIIGRHFSVFYPADAVDNGVPARELKEAETDGAFEHEGWRLRKDGSRFWASVSITPLWTPAGRLRGFAKVVRDDTDRRRAAQERTRLELLEARDRIAHDLHHEIVEDLFAVGLSLQGSLGLVDRDDLRTRLEGAVDLLDGVIRRVRETAWVGLDLGADPS